MADLTDFPHEFEEKKNTCRAIIETPKGSRNKFAYDRETNLFASRGLLPEGMERKDLHREGPGLVCCSWPMRC